MFGEQPYAGGFISANIVFPVGVGWLFRGDIGPASGIKATIHRLQSYTYRLLVKVFTVNQRLIFAGNNNLNSIRLILPIRSTIEVRGWGIIRRTTIVCRRICIWWHLSLLG